VLQELGRLLSALAAVLVTLAGRFWRGMQWLVRHARATRSVTAQGTPRLGRLLDLAALSAAADVLVLTELWRRGAPPGLGWAALIGVGAALVLGAGALATPRHVVRYAWSGLTLVRIVAIATFVLVPPAVSFGVGTPWFLSTLAAATLIMTMLVDRQLWTIVTRGLVAPTYRAGFVGGTLRYVALTVPFAVLAGFLSLVVGGLFALVLAEVALLALAVVALTLPAPTVVVPPMPLGPRKALPSQTVVSPTEILPAASAEPEGFTVYRPTSLDQ